MFLCEILTEQQQAPPEGVVVKAHVRNAPLKASEKEAIMQAQAQQAQEQQAIDPNNPQAVDPNQQQAIPQQIDPNQQEYVDMDYDPELDGEDGDGSEMVAQAPPFQEILPLKRYYLIEKLKNLKFRLDENNIKNEDLDTILKFVNSMSYSSLVSLSINLLPVIEEQLARLQTNEV